MPFKRALETHLVALVFETTFQSDGAPKRCVAVSGALNRHRRINLALAEGARRIGLKKTITGNAFLWYSFLWEDGTKVAHHRKA